MDKEMMIEIFFYIGYAVSIIFLLALFILICYLIFLRLLNLKKIRFFIFRLILRKSIDSLNDEKFYSLIEEMKKERSKLALNKMQ